MQGLSANNITIPKCYAPIFRDEYKHFILSSGRISGKTSILVAIWWVTINKYPDRDIVFLQATATEIKDSVINEIFKFLNNSGFDVSDNPNSEWYIPKAKDQIVHRGQKGTTYFYPITDSYGGQRTRGISTINPLSLVMFEEAQKNKDDNVLEQAVATFIRQVDDIAKIIIVGNNESAGHWFIDYVNDKRQDPTWCYIYACCYDIWNLLNDETREYLDNFRRINEVEFRRMYLGDINAKTSDIVFPQFSRDKHYKKVFDLEEHYIKTLIVGIDHATANDTYVACPVAILDNGTAQTLEVMYDDPQESNRSLSPSEQCNLLDQFMTFLDEKYGFVENSVPIVLSIDCAASSYISQLQHLKYTSSNKRLWRTITIKGFTLKKKDVNLGIIKNAFAYGVLTILNEGLYSWNGEPNGHRLVKEIEKLRYKNGKLDPNIPNDFTDALEYGLIPYYTNCYNMSYPIRKEQQRIAHYDDIRVSANIK